jgi:hypothetical protein
MGVSSGNFGDFDFRRIFVEWRLTRAAVEGIVPRKKCD